MLWPRQCSPFSASLNCRGPVQKLIDLIYRLRFGFNLSQLQSNVATVPGMQPSTGDGGQRNEDSGNETDSDVWHLYY
jgi:hypothetical protein